MTKSFFTILFGLMFSCLFSQEKEIYLNDDFAFISKAEFEQESDNEFDYTLRFESDTTFVNIKVQRVKKGKIDINTLNAIKTMLSKNSKQQIDSNDVLLINYYPGDGPCSTKGYKNNFKNMYRRYYRKIEKLEDIKQFFVYRSSENIEAFGSKIVWLPDDNYIIEKVFHPIHYPCGGYIIINNDGTYLSQRGEYSYSKSFIKEVKDFANN